METVELLVSEVVTNAVVHAGTDCRLRIRPLDGTRVRVEAADDAEPPPVLEAFTDDGREGRGLALVDVLAARWGCAPTQDAGKVVWFETGTQ